MRKLKAIISLTLIIFMLVPTMAGAYFNENNDFCILKGTPTLDGNISASEGWSTEKIILNTNTLAIVSTIKNAVDMYGTVYLAFDEDYIYFAADITEYTDDPYVSKEDLVSPSNANNLKSSDYGFEGDVFSLALDPMCVLTNAGRYSCRAPMYNVAYDSEGNGLICGTNGKGTELLSGDEGSAVVTLTDNGWMFEARVSIDRIIEDTEANYSKAFLDKDELLTNMADWKANMIYKSSRVDPEGGVVIDYNIYATVAESSLDGYPGGMTNGLDIKTFGLIIYLYDEDAASEFIEPFKDVLKSAWYAESIQYCLKTGYVSGVTDFTFCPDNNLTRAQFITMLAKIDGVELAAYKNKDSGFSDVNAGQWFHNAITWAAEKGYASGMSPGQFLPDANVTRQQLARFFYVYSEAKGIDVSTRGSLSKFSDASKIASWAYEQISWAVGVGLISGMTETTVAPEGNATRAQAARIIMTYTSNVIK